MANAPDNTPRQTPADNRNTPPPPLDTPFPLIPLRPANIPDDDKPSYTPPPPPPGAERIPAPGAPLDLSETYEPIGNLNPEDLPTAQLRRVVVLPESQEIPHITARLDADGIQHARPVMRHARPVTPLSDTSESSNPLDGPLGYSPFETDAHAIPFTTSIPLHTGVLSDTHISDETSEDGTIRHILSPVVGRTYGLDSTGDRAFQSGVFGLGLAIEPANGHIMAPVSGTITSLTTTGHAYAITTDDGLEIFIHIGIDTVLMGGVGFTPLVIRGQRINAGDPLADVDIGRVRSAGHRTLTIMTETTIHDPHRVHTLLGADVNVGDIVMSIDPPAEKPDDNTDSKPENEDNKPGDDTTRPRIHPPRPPWARKN